MSGSANDQKLQLEIQKLAKELDKLAVEIPKIRREASWRASVMPSVVSVGAVVVTTVVSIASVVNASRTQAYDQQKSDREFALNCVQSASAVAKLVFDQSGDFDRLSSSGKINFVNVILAAYPPSVAERFLRSLTPRLDPNDVDTRTAFQLAIGRVEAASAGGQIYPCPAVTDLIPVGVASITASPVPAASPGPGSPNAVPSPPPPPAAAPAARLTVYYQVTRSQDRAPATRVAQQVAAASARNGDAQFPAAAVQVVSTAAPLSQTEIRYYHRDQEDTARQLLALVQAAASQGGGTVKYIGDIFPNLPQGRVEVWLPPLRS